MIELLYIAIICVIVTDFTDFFQNVKKLFIWIGDCILPKYMMDVWKKNGYPCKPLECALCQTFWISLIYSIFYYTISFKTILMCVLIAFSTKYISSVIQVLDSWIGKIINKLL